MLLIEASPDWGAEGGRRGLAGRGRETNSVRVEGKPQSFQRAEKMSDYFSLAGCATEFTSSSFDKNFRSP